MPRVKRVRTAGIVQHVMNRGNRRAKIFHESGDYWAFMSLLAEAGSRFAIRLLAYCLMPNHWHLVVWPAVDGELSAYMRWLTGTHVRRYHRHYGLVGTGHLYQARYTGIPVQSDRHLLVVLRYTEANALRAGLVDQAEHWSWTSLNADRPDMRPALTPGPVRRPADWTRIVNQHSGGISRVRDAIAHGRPFGSESWTRDVASRYGLEFTLRGPGRPARRPDVLVEAPPNHTSERVPD